MLTFQINVDLPFKLIWNNFISIFITHKLRSIGTSKETLQMIPGGKVYCNSHSKLCNPTYMRIRKDQMALGLPQI